MSERPDAGQSRHRVSWWIGFFVLFIYLAWMMAPYMRSVIVRDAAVTSWIHVATSPIYGHVDKDLPPLDQRVGQDGRILTVVNERADRRSVDEADAEVAHAEANVDQLKTRMSLVRQLDAERQALVDRYALVFNRELETEVEGAKRELVHITERLELARSIADRKVQLARRGSTAQSDADEALSTVAELELLRAEREKLIAQAQLRRAAAEEGSFIASDGTDPDWASRSRDTLQLELASAASLLADAEAALVKTRIAAAAAKSQLERTSSGVVTAPPGAIIWSVMVGAGAAVDVGTPVVQWLDCRVMLVDAPVSDVEASLLRKGMTADVILEGETRIRPGTVLLVRGSASPLSGLDLAAVARGAGDGTAHVILTLEHSNEDIERCPIGQAAHVDFPDIDLIDILRARLRL